MMTWSSGGRWNPRLHNYHLADWSGRDALLQVGCHSGLKLAIEFKGNGVKVKIPWGLKTVLSEMILANIEVKWRSTRTAWQVVRTDVQGNSKKIENKNKSKKRKPKKLRRQLWQKWRQPEVLDSWSQFSNSSDRKWLLVFLWATKLDLLCVNKGRLQRKFS